MNELIEFNCANRKHRRLYRQWDAVRDAQCDFYYVTVRRAALKKLRDEIGEDEFSTGHMPHYVPDWRFASAPWPAVGSEKRPEGRRRLFFCPLAACVFCHSPPCHCSLLPTAHYPLLTSHSG
ncbi:MAG: hypothetical protein J0I06_11865 [Planctomycetes bacterium]|nr:hypothetical protein [Planctomycetota bacterium]